MVDPRSGNYDNLPHVGPGNMESFTGRLYDNVNTVKDDALISGKFHFNPGDIIYGKINPQLGKYTYAQFEGLASADAYVLNGKNGLTQEFLFGILQTKAFFDYSVSVSMRSGMPKINRDELNAFEFLAPNESEQRAIGDILLKLDDLITLHQRECGKPPFNQSPAWKQRKLGELCELNPTAVLPDSFEYVDLESVAGTDMISHRREEKLTAPSRAQRLASFGDIFYQTVRPYQKNNYFYELPDEDYVFSTGYAQLRPLCDGRFLFSSLQRDQFVSCVLEHCTGTSYPAINANDLAALFLAVPIDAEEQRLVGSILKPIDSLITLHQRMCPIFSFCAHGSRTNFAQTLQGWLQILRYPRPIPKMLVSPSAPASGVFGTAKGAFICASSSAGASTSSPSARKNFITSSTLCCRESLSSP